MERVWEKIDIRGPDECWPWTGNVNRQGYGVIKASGRSPRNPRVHRLVIDAPPGVDALHSCDNPPCCNPGHLRLGDNMQNRQDSVDRGRQARGERHGHSKLTEAQVLAIRSDSRKTEVIAKEYGVHPNHVLSIKRRARWQHLP